MKQLFSSFYSKISLLVIVSVISFLCVSFYFAGNAFGVITLLVLPLLFPSILFIYGSYLTHRESSPSLGKKNQLLESLSYKDVSLVLKLFLLLYLVLILLGEYFDQVIYFKADLVVGVMFVLLSLLKSIFSLYVLSSLFLLFFFNFLLKKVKTKTFFITFIIISLLCFFFCYMILGISFAIYPPF